MEPYPSIHIKLAGRDTWFRQSDVCHRAACGVTDRHFFFYIWPLCALLPRDTNCRSAGGTAAAEEVGVFTEETTGYCILYLLYLDGR